MFDLFRSRAKAVRYLLGGLLGIVALSMVITLIPGWNAPANSGGDNIVAEIGKSALTVKDVQNEMQQLVKGRQVPAELIPVYLPQRIDQMINERALAYQAERMGYEIPDAELAAYIRSLLPRFFQNGQLIDRNAYEQFLGEQGYTVQEFENNLRKQLLMTRLLNMALEGIVVTPDEVKQEYDRRNAKLKIAFVGFKADELKKQLKMTPAELETYYNQNKEGFREPEKRDIVVLVADQDKIAAAINVPDDQLKRAYDQRRDQFRTPERVRVRHILFMTQGKSPDEVNKIKAKAESVRKQLNDKNFAELAKANSDDTESKVKGGELGFVARGQTVKNFENASFTQKIGEISGLITTEYGFHIIQVEERQEARLAPFEEVKGKLAMEVKGAAVADKVQTSIEQARNALAKTPGNYEQIAQQYGLEVVKAEKVAPGAPVGSLGTVAELDQALTGLKPNEVSPVFQLAPTKLAAAEVIGTTPPRVMTFAEAESRVKDNYAAMKVQQLINDRAKQAADRAKAGEDLAKIAKDLGGEYKTPAEFTADGAIEGLGAATTVSDAFSKPVGTVLGPMNIVGQQVVVKVVDKSASDPAGIPMQRDAIVLALKKKKSTERRDLFQDSILAQLLKDGKVKKHDETIKRLMASYRS
jgi:peptidyl-prolyl cis-trans isomerase D